MTVVLEQLFFGLFLPALACALVLGLLWLPWRRRASSRTMARLGAALGTVAGYTVGHGFVVGWTFFPPRENLDSKHWLPYLALGAAIPAIVDSVHRPRLWVLWSIEALVSALAVWLVVRPETDVLVGLTLGLTGLWIVVGPLTRHRGGVGPGLTMLVVALAASCILARSGGASFGLLTGVLAACLPVLAMAAWWKPDLSFLHGASGAVVVLPAVLWLNLYFYFHPDVPLASGVLLAAAMASGWLPETATRWGLARWQSTSLRLLGALVPAVVAVLVAWNASDPGVY